MQTFILSQQNADTPVESLIKQAAAGGVEVRNAAGKTVAYVIPADNPDARLYAEAREYFGKHRAEFDAVRGRRTGISTAELLTKAAASAAEAPAP